MANEKTLGPRIKNIQKKNRIDPKKVPTTSYQIRAAEFIKVLPKDGECFKYLCSQFPGLSEAKLKDSVFVEPNINKFQKNEHFETNEKGVWRSFKQLFWEQKGDKLQIYCSRYVEKVWAVI